MIIRIDGCAGSGKSTLVRTLIDSMWEVHLYTPRSGVYVYDGVRASSRYNILGDYRPTTLNGGMDSIKGVPRRVALIKECLPKCDHLIFEGMMHDTAYAPENFGTKPEDWLYVFMDLPMEAARQRVHARRRAAGFTKVERDVEVFERQYHVVQARRAKRISSGDNYLLISSKNSVATNVNSLFDAMEVYRKCKS